MKVLIQMGDSFPDESPCAKRMRTFQDVFRENGNQVIVLAPRTASSIEGYPDTVYCPTVPLRKKTVFYRFLNSLFFAVTSYFKAKRIKNVDIVITTTPPPLINWWGRKIAKSHHARLVYDVRDIWPDVAWEIGSFSKNSLYSRIFGHIRDTMLKSADMIITVSSGKVKKLQAYNPRAKVIEIPNGLDEEFLKNRIDFDVVKKYELNRGFICSYVGNLGLAQGLRQLLKIAEKAKAQIPDARFLIFGSGAEEKFLKKYAEEHRLSNVEFFGRVPNKQVYTVLKYSSIAFVSLVNENLKNSIPTKIYEALGVGCPVLLAAVGDSADIVKNSGLGITVNPNEPEALWQAYLNMYKNIEEYEHRKLGALKYIIKNYSRQRAAKVLEFELEQLVKQ